MRSSRAWLGVPSANTSAVHVDVQQWPRPGSLLLTPVSPVHSPMSAASPSKLTQSHLKVGGQPGQQGVVTPVEAEVGHNDRPHGCAAGRGRGKRPGAGEVAKHAMAAAQSHSHAAMQQSQPAGRGGWHTSSASRQALLRVPQLGNMFAPGQELAPRHGRLPLRSCCRRLGFCRRTLLGRLLLRRCCGCCLLAEEARQRVCRQRGDHSGMG